MAAPSRSPPDKKRGIREHQWAQDNRHILFLQDEGGDENWRVYSVDVQTGEQVDLSPYKDVQAQIVGVSYKRPGVALIALNDRAPEWHDLYEIDITTAKRTLVEKNEQEFGGYIADFDLKPRMAVKPLPSGGEIYRRGDKGWKSCSTTVRKTLSLPRRSPSRAMAATHC